MKFQCFMIREDSVQDVLGNPEFYLSDADFLCIVGDINIRRELLNHLGKKSIIIARGGIEDNDVLNSNIDKLSILDFSKGVK